MTESLPTAPVDGSGWLMADDPSKRSLFPHSITLHGSVTLRLHADGRLTGATASEWQDALERANGLDYSGIYLTAWLLLRELQRQEGNR